MAALGMFLVVLFFSSIMHYVMRGFHFSLVEAICFSHPAPQNGARRGEHPTVLTPHIMAPTDCEVLLSRWMEH